MVLVDFGAVIVLSVDLHETKIESFHGLIFLEPLNAMLIIFCQLATQYYEDKLFSTV